MPPAFNLSQDQTLQFDLYKSLNQRWPHPPGLPPENKTFGLPPLSFHFEMESRTALCEHQCLGTFPPTQPLPARPGPQAPVPTPIGCQLLKNRLPRGKMRSRARRSGNQQQRGAIIGRFQGRRKARISSDGVSGNQGVRLGAGTADAGAVPSRRRRLGQYHSQIVDHPARRTLGAMQTSITARGTALS